MTYQIRKSSERKYFDHEWLKTYHTFSFGSYYDPQFMGFRSLRVINEDQVAPGKGFPPHNHSDMEIISVILEGELAHKDSMGTETIIHTNEVQTMSAGSGITHSEYNPSKEHFVHFLQIWITPENTEITPRYQQKTISSAPNEWTLLASNQEKENSLKICQDVNLFSLLLDTDKEIDRKVATNRYGWLQVIDGNLSFNNDLLHKGDGVAIQPNSLIKLKALDKSKVLFFDLN